jgi:hypothetical protein
MVEREYSGHGHGKLVIEISDGKINDIIREVRTRTKVNQTTK